MHRPAPPIEPTASEDDIELSTARLREERQREQEAEAPPLLLQAQKALQSADTEEDIARARAILRVGPF